MSDSRSWCEDNEVRLRAEAARKARRATMTEREALIEDLLDQYTQAVKDTDLLKFFGRIADYMLAVSGFMTANVRLDSAARDAAAVLRNFIDKLNELDAARGEEQPTTRED